MTDKILFILLSTTRNSGNVKKLIHEGVAYKEIGDFIMSAIETGYLQEIGGKVSLTKAGEGKFNELKKKFKNTNKAEWIDEENKSKISKIDQDAVFLPNQKELTF